MEIIAHRGLATKNVENSIPAFLDAVNNGADAIELDIHETRDGKIIVFHDYDLNRLFGLNLNIYDAGWDQLSSLTFPGREYGIPLLEEVLRKIEVKLYIEIKSMDDKGKRYYPKLPDRLAEMLKEYGRNDTIISFDPFPLLYEKDIYKFKTGLDMDGLSMKLLGKENISYYIEKVDFILPDWEIINEFMNIDRKKIIAWTINNINDLKKAEEYQLYGIITDRVDIIAGDK